MEIQPYEAAEAAYHRLARLGQRVVLALLMNAAVGLDGDAYRPLRAERVAGVVGSIDAKQALVVRGHLRQRVAATSLQPRYVSRRDPSGSTDWHSLKIRAVQVRQIALSSRA